MALTRRELNCFYSCTDSRRVVPHHKQGDEEGEVDDGNEELHEEEEPAADGEAEAGLAPLLEEIRSGCPKVA